VHEIASRDRYLSQVGDFNKKGALANPYSFRLLRSNATTHEIKVSKESNDAKLLKKFHNPSTIWLIKCIGVWSATKLIARRNNIGNCC
jgi:hypothetical protein